MIILTRLLITGGAGLIGRNLIKKLGSKFEITIFDNLSNTPKWHTEELSSNINLVIGDVRNFDDIDRSMHNIDTVVHLAASGSVVESVVLPKLNFDNNVMGTFNVLEAAKKHEVKKLVFASTGGALIGDVTPPVNEESLPKPISPYGASKLCGEAYCNAYAKAYGINTVALRFANVFGPYSAHKRGAVTAFIKAIMKNEPITIYGNGEASRDFLYVEDLCDGIIRSIDSELNPGEVLHLASGVETTILELVEQLLTIAGVSDHPIQFLDTRPAEVIRNFAKYDKALEKIGFSPKWTLAEGLKATWQWFLQNRSKIE